MLETNKIGINDAEIQNKISYKFENFKFTKAKCNQKTY